MSDIIGCSLRSLYAFTANNIGDGSSPIPCGIRGGQTSGDREKIAYI